MSLTAWPRRSSDSCAKSSATVSTTSSGFFLACLASQVSWVRISFFSVRPNTRRLASHSRAKSSSSASSSRFSCVWASVATVDRESGSIAT